jgi:hypothetical protein
LRLQKQMFSLMKNTLVKIGLKIGGYTLLKNIVHQ